MHAFDLPARATLALNCLTRLLDPKRNYQPYFGARYDVEPAVAFHTYWDYGDGTGRFLDALALARIMTGNKVNDHVDEKLKEFGLSLIHEDGLTWIPEAPWVGEPYAEIFSQRSTLLGLLTLYQRDGDPEVLGYLRRMVEGLDRIAIKKDGYAYFPHTWSLKEKRFLACYFPEGWHSLEEPIDDGNAAWSGVVIFPLVKYAELFGDQRALELAGKLIRFTLERARDFNSDGSFDRFHERHRHYHSRAATITGVLKYGLVAGEKGYVDWARNAYEKAKSRWNSSFGFSPENLNNLERCETCNITDTVEIALLLARNGYPQYWDDAERYGLNHLLESQMLHGDWLARLPVRRPAERCMGEYCGKPKGDCSSWEECVTLDSVIERNVGGFAGWSAPNDYIALSAPAMMQCCNGAGTRGLYGLWHSAVSKSAQGLSVNLALSRDTRWARVRSYLPAEGKIEITPLEDTRLLVRKPGPVAGEQVRVLVDGQPVATRWADSFVVVGPVQAGQQAVVSFPLEERRVTEKIGEREYTTTWRGNFIMEIEPPGSIYPLYQREHRLERQGPRPEGYYVPEREIDSL